MELPNNSFKKALKAGIHQIGIWNSIAGNSVPELLATCGFDWILIDTEHAPTEAVEIQSSLQSMAAYENVSAIVRPAANDPILIKRILDMGALTLLLPYIQSPQEAKDAVSYVTYGPNGLRGMAGMTRATRYGMVENYFERASEEICLLVQVETMEAIEQLDAIALTPGIDGVFIGPADLSASMGYPGEINHPEVVKVIMGAISKLNSLNVPSGILTLDFDSAKRYINAGTSFTAVGVDMVLLAESTRNLRKQFT